MTSNTIDRMRGSSLPHLAPASRWPGRTDHVPRPGRSARVELGKVRTEPGHLHTGPGNVSRSWNSRPQTRAAGGRKPRHTKPAMPARKVLRGLALCIHALPARGRVANRMINPARNTPQRELARSWVGIGGMFPPLPAPAGPGTRGAARASRAVVSHAAEQGHVQTCVFSPGSRAQ